MIQHFTKTLARVPGADFRLPTDEELDALEAFQRSLVRKEDPKLPLPSKGAVARRGQEPFLDRRTGKCNFCHVNAGASADFGGGNLGNRNFDTGVENLPGRPARLAGEKPPRDDGFGTPGDGTFDAPPLVEAADTGPFFHDNSVATLEAAVAFYDGGSFNNSPAGKALAGATGSGIRLDATQTQAIASFLRVLNALENIRSSVELLESAAPHDDPMQSVFEQAIGDIGDAIRVLREADLHPEALAPLETARRSARKAQRGLFTRAYWLQQAAAAPKQARAALVE